MGSFHIAVHEGRAGRLIRLVRMGEDIDEKDDCGFTPLHVATTKKNKEITRLLIELGANVDIATENEWTALHICAQLGEKETAEALIENGAYIEASDRDGCVPLHVCANHGTTEVAILLLDKGARVEVRNKHGWTPLHISAEKGRLGIAQLLLERGADKEALGKRSWRPLHLCAQENTVDVAKALFEKRADVGAFEDGGRNPLHICAQFGSTEMAVAVIKQGAGVNEMTTGGESALHLCARFGTTKTAVALMEHGAAIDVRDSNGDTALHKAVSCENEDLVYALVSRCNTQLVNLANSRGLTPLHLAVSQNFQSIRETLVQAGARHDIKDNDGKMPVDHNPMRQRLGEIVKADATTQEPLERPSDQKVASIPQQKGWATLTSRKHIKTSRLTDVPDRPSHPRFETLDEVHRGMHAVNLEASELIVGVDFTKSNLWTGKNSFGERCLHEVGDTLNPYLETLTYIAKRLGVYDDDHSIPCYGFGDVTTTRRSVFSFFRNNAPAKGLEALVDRYRKIAPLVHMSGPTSFAPLIRQSMRVVYDSGMKFHVLLILADGQVSDECMEETKKAIVDACAFPLSIVMIGVGDGPWTDMNMFDDALPERPWDNFNFFEFDKVVKGTAVATEDRRQDRFEHHVLEELPAQYKHARTRAGVKNKANVSHYINAIPASVLREPPTHFG